MSRIDFTRLRHVLEEVNEIVASLDGIDLDETNALTSNAKGRARQEKAKRSQDLQLLATRLELGAALVRVEYWCSRGESDPLGPVAD